jgi:hypothetical protein
MTPMTQRADLADRLQAAVAERDAPLARRLTDQLVHRRGVAALEALLQGPLAALQGPAAVAWLAELIQVAPHSEPALPLQRPDRPQAVDGMGLDEMGTQAGAEPLAVLEPDPLSQPPVLAVSETVQVEQAAPERAPLALRLVPPPMIEPPATPAPAPAALAALRSWLPDPSDLAEAG